MREIKFRGCRRRSDQWSGWHYGDLWHEKSGVCVGSYEVDSSTVGQFTGLKDADGLEIYEGDVLQKRDELAWRTVNKGVVFWHSDECRWCVKLRDGLVFSLTSRKATTWHVISNIHDNPELLRSRDFA